MRAMQVTAGVATLLTVVGIAASGCSTEDDGDTGSTTSTVAQPWDPCSLSDAALRKATLDPETQGPGLSAEGPGEESCGWKSTDNIGVIITAIATAKPDQFRNGTGNIDFREVTVDGRQAFTYREEGDEQGVFCHLVVPFRNGGLALMQVDRSVFTKETTPMCEWAVQIGDALVAEMPN